MSDDILPNSVPRETRSRITHVGLQWVPIFCANCGADGGHIPEDANDFAFYLCVPCGEKWAPLTGYMLTPDEVFWKKLNAAQIEKHGRVLDPLEQAEELKNGDSMLSKLGRER